MLTSTVNNFGAGEISFADYQSDRLVVLNARISFNPRNAEFTAASVLKITVPQLSVSKSAKNYCSIMARFDDQTDYRYATPHGTFLKTWIENGTTVCIEKINIPEWSETATEYIIYLYSLYVPKGKRGVMIPEKKGVSVPFTLRNPANGTKYGYAYVEDGWVMLEITQSSYYHEPEDRGADEITMQNFTNDISLEVPFFSADINTHRPGAKVHKALLQGNRITALEQFQYLTSGSSDDFIHIFAVRGTYSPEENAE